MIAVLHIIPALLWSSVGAVDCAEARHQYGAMEPERAIETVEAVLAGDATRPLPCLEVKALALLVVGQLGSAKRTLQELFSRDAGYQIVDPSLSPAMRDTIEQIRQTAAAMSAQVRARWLIHDSLRVDVVLQGGLRGAERVRYSTFSTPGEERSNGEMDLVGRTASATVAVLTPGEVTSIAISGVVLAAGERVVHEFSSKIPLVGRPAPPAPREVVVEVGDGIPWPVWLGVGLGVVGAAVAIGVLAQPSLPDTEGTVGRVEIPQ